MVVNISSKNKIILKHQAVRELSIQGRTQNLNMASQAADRSVHPIRRFRSTLEGWNAGDPVKRSHRQTKLTKNRVVPVGPLVGVDDENLIHSVPSSIRLDFVVSKIPKIRCVTLDRVIHDDICKHVRIVAINDHNLIFLRDPERIEGGDYFSPLRN